MRKKLGLKPKIERLLFSVREMGSLLSVAGRKLSVLCSVGPELRWEKREWGLRSE